jgi:(1->4)-alpha-D-glucan 1-alpha-D-glucosylmutase
VALHRIARRDLLTRDTTLTAIQRTLTELLAHFHVYRIYAGATGLSQADRTAMDWALAGARRTVRAMDRHLLELLAQWLSGESLRSVPAGTRRREFLRAMVRFQQLSAPTAAKSVEDTAFYRYGRLLSRNEVGTEPSQFAMTESAYHAAMRDRRKRMPHALLATATHDHKRGEDARMRLAVLSEIPAEWEAALQRWMRLNAPLRRDLNGPAPDAADEVMLYQTLIGAWPLGLTPDDRAGMEEFRERVAAWQEKALREAKRHSGWAAPNEAYEQACQAFLAGVLDPDRPARVVQDICAFVARIAPAGAMNGLSQLLLRVTGPGIPDLYQGCEFWDFSLVDPDNRRPVDFDARARALADAPDLPALRAHWRDGRIKLHVLARAMAFRAAAPDLFLDGDYTPLKLEGAFSGHAMAAMRSVDGHHAITVISRCAAALDVKDTLTIPVSYWDGTSVILPASLVGLQMHDRLREDRDGGTRIVPARLPVGDLLRDLPVALLEVR